MLHIRAYQKLEVLNIITDNDIPNLNEDEREYCEGMILV
jgi:hypothetical protein